MVVFDGDTSFSQLVIDDDCTYLYSRHYADTCENVSVLFVYVKLDGFDVGCDAVKIDRLVPTFRRNLLRPSS
jgi:hypothetical protein